ncbi:unnamed protein product, partial [Allacma fusca]
GTGREIVWSGERSWGWGCDSVTEVVFGFFGSVKDARVPCGSTFGTPVLPGEDDDAGGLGSGHFVQGNCHFADRRSGMVCRYSRGVLVSVTVTLLIRGILLSSRVALSLMGVTRSCEKRNHEGMCTFPTANVTLTKRQQLLMVGQPYRILLEMEMPESPSNQNLGMFMVCLDLNDKEGVNIDHACRSAMLHYKSYLHHAIYTLFFSPFLLSGSSEEKQIVQVELFTGFEEDPNRPITEAVIEIQSHHVEIYKTSLQIHAHFTGLRYVMFHWPFVSAVVGITTNLFFLSIIAFLSWFKFFSPKQVTYPVGYDSNQAKSLEERRALAK